MGEDRTVAGRQRVSVAQTAEILGVSVEAVRGRIKRGTLEAVRDGDHVFVLLEADQSRPDTDQSTDQAQPDALISAKDETIALLRAQLEAERQAHAEARRIIAGLVERIPPAIEPPRQEPSESPVRPGPMETPAEGSGGPQRGSERPWWRRIFGGEE